jgi:hypothetical protein
VRRQELWSLTPGSPADCGADGPGRQHPRPTPTGSDDRQLRSSYVIARKAEVVQPRKLPDGLLEARFHGSNEPALVLVAVATYPEERVVQQVQDDIRLVRQARGVLPDAFVLCLCPRGNYRVPQQAQESSRLGWTASTLSWKVVELCVNGPIHRLGLSRPSAGADPPDVGGVS